MISKARKGRFMFRSRMWYVKCMIPKYYKFQIYDGVYTVLPSAIPLAVQSPWTKHINIINHPDKEYLFVLLLDLINTQSINITHVHLTCLGLYICAYAQLLFVRTSVYLFMHLQIMHN